MLILLHISAILTRVRGRRIMANMSAFQANDASSILAARTKEIDRVIDTVYFFDLCYVIRTRISEQSEPDESS